ncbi:bifunctional phosphoribosylaminoimidazolecarboxamide formyltransferase/IMP cyclohydrolase [Boudabousia liubingyangii]|uniref:Bifunctional purine biosynthesis protein PurH n=1 Tax=Boudabousia liubingyangii TaxID=1921764 RepID=A0A1Q5PJN6_9ACTO|nr:bifunctional phosphoribosylaminoimidazolecarboxamide formyltransferase/IMP cyclohydrolase [Boudabousia liubingyangii]OKL46146.1 bifunctional phosphoribosylaminoimidazolecarboxamide formyltransferase/IMP cyclohydrolase [Boudabousia liubingyangii]
MPKAPTTRRALISVYNKTGLEDLARGLVAAGIEIVSTGSTAQTIEKAGLPVTPVSAVTEFPECLDGRVKTLHPKIHGGILANRSLPTHLEQLSTLEITPIDIVVCNLYPFVETVKSGADFPSCVEQIDIGGPSMVRAAAKNHKDVTVIVNPERYPDLLAALAKGGFDAEERKQLAAEAFRHTADYDREISTWMAQQLAGDNKQEAADATSAPEKPAALNPQWEAQTTLRYGENPHQAAELYTDGSGHGIANAKQLHGKPMSYNNYTDGDAALRAAYDHEEPCVAVIKHANPCGIAIAEDVATAHRKAHACDPVSAFGGVIAVNRPVTVELAEQIVPIFTEVVLAPAYEEGALEVLSRKKNLRVLEVEPAPQTQSELKVISGGALAQSVDQIDQDGDDPANWQLVSGPGADEATLADLAFAWRTVRAVKSNAVLLVKDQATVGVGMGQVNRVDSVKLAVERANTLGARSTGDAAVDIDTPGGARAEAAPSAPERARGSVCASDAFFPFADGVQYLIDAGVKAIVQPGGSIRDEESIAAAQAAGVTMYLTGVRHFFH